MDATLLKSRAIYVTRHGSHAYGLNTPTSDLDVKGVLIARPEHYFGFLHRVEQIEEREPNDLVIYEIQKFFKLASDCNPNIIEVLFTEDEDVLYINPLGRELRGMRELFLSQKAKFTFSGYAMAQLKRMKNHHEWMKSPPQKPLDRLSFGLRPNKDWCDHIDLTVSKGEQPCLTDETRAEYEREKQWREQSKKWAHYQEWLAGRNPARHALEAKFGYDTKHGMHLVRLMRMGHEIIKTGKVVVKRPDREELLAIRNDGIWSYEQIVAYAERMDAELTEVYKSNTSPLPKEPPRALLDASCQGFVAAGIGQINDCSYDWNGLVR